MNPKPFRRLAGTVVALFLNLGLALMLSDGLRLSKGVSSPEPSGSVLILLRLSPPPKTAAQADSLPPHLNDRDGFRPTPAMPALQLPAPLPMPPSGSHPPPTDWALEAHRSAQGLLTRESFEQQQRRRIGGDMPLSNFDASKGPTAQQRPLFTWGHQPISKGFDAGLDETTHMPSLTLGPCRIVLVWLLPAFGCGVPWDKPEEETHESFDARYRPNDIEVPVPMITEPEPQEH